MTDDAVYEVSGSQAGQQQPNAGVSDTIEIKAPTPKKRVAKGAINPTKRKKSRKRDQVDADGWDRELMDALFTPSFNEILRCAMKVPSKSDYLETVQDYFSERLSLAAEEFESTMAPTAFKYLIRLKAKLAVIAIVLSEETQEAIQRVHARF